MSALSPLALFPCELESQATLLRLLVGQRLLVVAHYKAPVGHLLFLLV